MCFHKHWRKEGAPVCFGVGNTLWVKTFKTFQQRTKWEFSLSRESLFAIFLVRSAEPTLSGGKDVAHLEALGPFSFGFLSFPSLINNTVQIRLRFTGTVKSMGPTAFSKNKRPRVLNTIIMKRGSTNSALENCVNSQSPSCSLIY